MRQSIAIAAAVASLGTAVVAGDWPQWRGPRADGTSEQRNLPVRWSDGENVAWKAALKGTGISTPIVWGDLVIATSQDGASVRRSGRHPTLVQGGDAAAEGERPIGVAAGVEKTVFVVTALSRESGERVWEHQVEAEGELPPVHEKHNLATASPATDGEHVFAWFGTGQLVALEMTGRRVWMRHLGTEYAPFDIQWGHGSSPVVHGDALLLVCYHNRLSYLLSLDKRTGKVRWKADREPGVLSYSTPIVVDGPKGPEVVINSSEGIDGFDAETGERLWHFAESNRFPIPMPVPGGDRLYLSRGYRSGPYMALRRGGRGDIGESHVAWRVPTGAPYVSSLVHADGLVYMAGDVGIVTCVDAATGEKVWQERLDGVFTASPVAADGKVYLAGESGETIVLQAGRAPKVLARNTISGRLLASPAIAGGRIFLRTDDAIVAIGDRGDESR
jgi:outer membrane protein assembly factor BamB